MQVGKSLTGSRSLDFWLLGGASVVIYGLLYIVSLFKLSELPGFVEYGLEIGGTMFVLSLFVNNPHFLASYKFAYLRGVDFIYRNTFQLLFVPVFLVMMLIFAYFEFATPIPIWLNSILPNINLFEYDTLGFLILGTLLNLMFLSVGWHYVKQAFGVTMVYAKFDNFQFSKHERLIIRYSMLMLWIFSFVASNVGAVVLEISGFKYQGYNIDPIYLKYVTYICNFMILTLISIFILKYIKTKAIPSITMLTPIVAMYIWFYPNTYIYSYVVLIVPFFHSLQYLAFAYKVESETVKELESKSIKEETESFIGKFYRQYMSNLSFIFIMLIITGWAAFEFIPKIYDYVFYTEAKYGFGFMLVASIVFINVHHYFIDNVLWRFGGENVQKLMR